MRKFILLLIILFIGKVSAQQTDNSKYLGEIVPIVDGKVVFTKEFLVQGLSEEQIYTNLLGWLDTRFQSTKNSQGRIVYADQDKGQIVGRGDEYLVFAEKALSVDRARINYQVFLFCTDNNCTVEVTNISYLYPESEKNKISAEEWITDDKALNKKRTRLYPGMGKFRIKTVDLAEELFEEIENVLMAQDIKKVSVTSKEIIPIVETNDEIIPQNHLNPTSIAGYKQVSPDKIPGNIIKLLSESWSLITAGDDANFNMMTASWGGIGCLYGKPVSFCFINPARYTYQLMENGDYYTISFYTEAYREALEFCGSNSGRELNKVDSSGLTPVTLPSGCKSFSEAWMILECKKMVSQFISTDAMDEEELKNKWEGKPTHKMYVGEIVNVWIK